MKESTDHTEHEIDDVSDPIEKVKESNGDLVLDFDSRVGARPFARYVNGDWELMSLTYIPTPSYGQDDPEAEHGINTRVHTVDLEPDMENNSEEELREMAKQGLYAQDDGDEFLGVNVIPFKESPFSERDEIPTKNEIVQERKCENCEATYRLYIPDPQSQCPHCGSDISPSVK